MPSQAVTTHTPVDTDVDSELAVYALHGILSALDWIDDNFLEEKLYPAQIKEARSRLITAGKILCERTIDRL